MSAGITQEPKVLNSEYFKASSTAPETTRNPQSKTSRGRYANQAFAGSKPASGPILVATSTCSRVAVLRTLPEMVMSASETIGCCSASESRRSLTLKSC